MEPLLLKADEVAAALGIGRSKAYELLQNGTLPVVKIGRCRRVPANALRKWVEQETAKAEAEAQS